MPDEILLPSTLEKCGYGASGWNLINAANLEKLNDGIGYFLNGTKGAGIDVQLKSSGNTSASTAFKIIDSDSHLIFLVRNDERVGIRVASPTETLDVSGYINTDSGIKKGGTMVVGTQQTAVADVTITTTETAGGTYTTTEQDAINHLKADVTSLKNQLNELLLKLRAHGLIATAT